MGHSIFRRFLIPQGSDGRDWKLPNVSDFDSDDGLLDDIFSRESRIESAHENGINVLRIDGSGRFIRRSDMGSTEIQWNNSNDQIRDIWEVVIKNGDSLP